MSEADSIERRCTCATTGIDTAGRVERGFVGAAGGFTASEGLETGADSTGCIVGIGNSIGLLTVAGVVRDGNSSVREIGRTDVSEAGLSSAAGCDGSDETSCG